MNKLMNIIFALTFLIIIIIMICSCGTTTSSKINYNFIRLSQEETDLFHQEYDNIDLNNLTSKQKKYLKEFDKQLQSHGLNGSDIEFIRLFPWINIRHLTDQDKIFLMQVATELGNGIMSSM